MEVTTTSFLYHPKLKPLFSSCSFTSTSSLVRRRRELFGCNIPPGLKTRYKKCRRLRCKKQIGPRCLLEDSSVVERIVVAFAATTAALAAVRFVFSHYYTDWRRNSSSTLEVVNREHHNETVTIEFSEQDTQNASTEVNVEVTEPPSAELVDPQVKIEEEETHNAIEVLVSKISEEVKIEEKENHNTSEVLASKISEEILASNLTEELEMSKAFVPINALEFAVSNGEGSPVKSEGRVTVAYTKEGPSDNVKKLEKSYESNRNEDKNKNSFKHVNGKATQLPQTNGNLKGIFDPSENLRTYNSLLKDGRLRDCVDLLETMEDEGTLNMEKIHHSSFLKACKTRKAVQEAIRFVKLIQRPKMSTFNMLLSVCASSQDFDGASQVMTLLKEAGLQPDCKLYTTLISTLGKSGKVDAMFETFHEMVNGGIEPNVNTYGALIDGCARARQVAKAFGAYGILRSKNVQPDRVVFNALITTCGESGAVDRAFDVLAEMLGENVPVLPDHVTVGALLKTCINAGMVDKAKEVYKMLNEYNIIGTVEVYTIAIRSCSLNGDLEFALQIYEDMKRKGIKPDEIFLSTIIDVAGHAGNIEVAFDVLNEARKKGNKVGNISHSSLMGACSKVKDWEKALQLYEEIKSRKIIPNISMVNALITALCEGGQITKSIEIFEEMKKIGVQANDITYAVLIIGCEKNNEAELAFDIYEQSKMAEIPITPTICGCLTGLCLQRYEKDSSLGNVSVTFNTGKPQITSKWTSLALDVYNELLLAGLEPKIDILSQVIGCMKFPNENLSRHKMIENLVFGFDASNGPNISGLLDGFGEYDPRSFQIVEEAAGKGIVRRLNFKDDPLTIDARKLQTHTAEVYVLATMKALKHRLAAGAKLPTITILLPTERTQIQLSTGSKTIHLSSRIGQAVGSLIRRLGIRHSSMESRGKILITGLALKRWFEPKLEESSIPVNDFLGNDFPGNHFPGNGFPGGNGFQGMPIHNRLGKGIADQQRSIRSNFDD